MIDTEALEKIVIDKATAGLLSSSFAGDGDVNEIIAKLPPVSNKRKKLLEQSFAFENKYDIPTHWKWVRLGEISSYGDTPTKVMPSDMKDGSWILELEDIESGGRLLSKMRYPARKPVGEKTVFYQGQILYSKLRPYLKKVLVADEDGISTPELISFDVFAGINTKYISYCLINSYADRIINQRSYGVKMPRVDAGFMANLPIPMPPLDEQERIVNIVEQAFEEIDTIVTLQRQYESDLSVLKSKIIDASIRGKLTEQLPEDGDAETLYAQIQEEKAKLIKEGKIKKEKPLPEIDADEIPYEIPKNWKWVRIGKVINEVVVPQRDKPPFSGNIPWCRIEDREGIFLKGTKSGQYVSEETVEKMNLRVFPVGTVLSACSGASIGTVLITTVECCTNQTFNGLVCNKGLYNWFLFWYLKAEINKLRKMGSGSAMAYVSQDKIRNMLIPLPPYEEQKRITMTIDEMMQIME